MKRLRFLAIWLTAFLLALLLLSRYGEAAPPPPHPSQPHGDIFSCGVPDCGLYNPVTVKGRAQRTVNYRLIVMPGCVQGSIVSDLEAIRIELQDAVQFRFVRNDGAGDFTIRVNCGTDQVRICGSVNIFCLGRGFPGIADVEMSDIMYSPVVWPEITRLSILCHEVCGHAIATWDEQYCKGISYPAGHICQGLARFTPAPGWVDFMNTGPNSRVLFNEITFGRWERTMYELEPRILGVQGFYGASYFADGRMEVYYCQSNVPGATRAALMAVAPSGEVYWSGNHLPLSAGCLSFPIVSEPGWCFDLNLEDDGTSWMHSRNDVRLGCR